MMVLYYGLLALETANNTVTATSSSSQRESISKISLMSSTSSSNSWIYTEDLRKRFEERYSDYRYIFVPIYINDKSSDHNSNRKTIISRKFHCENSWIYSRSVRNYLFNSTLKISSSSFSVTNQTLMRDQLPMKKKFLQRFLSLKHQSINTCSSSTLNKIKNLILEEDEDEYTVNQNHSIPLIKHSSVISSNLTNESSNNNVPVVNQSIKTKPTGVQNNRLTRLRSFFFKSSTSSLSRTQ